MGLLPAWQPHQFGRGRCLQRHRITGLGDLQQGQRARRIGQPGQFLEDAGHRRQCGLIGHQQHLAYPGWRLPFPALAAVRTVGIGGQQHHAVARPCMRGPARGRSGLAMQHEVDVDLALAGTQLAEGKGAHRRPRVIRQCPVTGIPVFAAGHVRRVLAGQGEKHLDTLVRAFGLHVRHVGAGEHHAVQRRRKNAALLQRHLEQAVGLLRSHAGTSCDDIGMAGCRAPTNRLAGNPSLIPARSAATDPRVMTRPTPARRSMRRAGCL